MGALILEYKADGGVSSIRTVKEGDDVYFALEDVVKVLASENSNLSVKGNRYSLSGLVAATLDSLDQDEKVHRKLSDGENRSEVFVTEPGLYRIVLRDSSPAAKRFQRWVIHEVLPSIRQHGVYPPPETGGSELRTLAHRLLENTNLLVQEIEKRERLEEEMKARFSQNETAIEEISERLETIVSKPGIKYHFESVSAVAARESLDQKGALLLWAHAAKICVEEGYPTNKASPNDQLSHEFPSEVIKRAISFIR